MRARRNDAGALGVRWRVARSLAIAGALALVSSTGAASLDATPDTGVFLRFVNAPTADEPIRNPPSLFVSFGGRRHRATMDTGSTGVVVSADMIPNVDKLPSAGAGTLAYSSSGRIMRGDWVITPVTITGRNGASVTTTPVPVLAVKQIDCFDNARNCTPTQTPRGVAMLGVGFARQADHQHQSTPDKNPFLNLPGMATTDRSGGVRRGYIVTRQGVQVGLTEADMRGDFHLVALSPADGARDWSAGPACISVNEAPAACGTVLVDTGVTGMFLTVPPAQQDGSVAPGEPGGRTLVAGTKVTITLDKSGGQDGASYGFAVGDADHALAPSRLTLVGGPSRATFVNTSVHFLNGFDYLYDADGGHVGYRSVPRPAAKR
jgi:hypothetical protein